MHPRFALAASIAGALALSACMRMAPPTPSTADAFAAMPAGRAVELVVRVDSVSGATLRGRLAEQVRESTYSLTKPVTLILPPQTPVSMGSIGDIQPNAVIFVRAIVTARGQAQIKKATVLTSYVHIE